MLCGLLRYPTLHPLALLGVQDGAPADWPSEAEAPAARVWRFAPLSLTYELWHVRKLRGLRLAANDSVTWWTIHRADTLQEF